MNDFKIQNKSEKFTENVTIDISIYVLLGESRTKYKDIICKKNLHMS